MQRALLVVLVVGCGAAPDDRDCRRELGGSVELRNGQTVARLVTAGCGAPALAALEVDAARAALPALDGLRQVEPLGAKIAGLVDGIWCASAPPAEAETRVREAFRTAGWHSDGQANDQRNGIAAWTRGELTAHIIVGQGDVKGCDATGDSFIGIALTRR